MGARALGGEWVGLSRIFSNLAEVGRGRAEAPDAAADVREVLEEAHVLLPRRVVVVPEPRHKQGVLRSANADMEEKVRS